MSTRPYVSVTEVRQRCAAAVEALEGFRELVWPLSTAEAPAGYDTFPFAIVASSTENTGRYRDNASSGICVRSTLIVEFLVPVTLADGSEVTSLDTATEAEARVIRAMEKRGEAWAFDLVVAYQSTTRLVTEDGGHLAIDITFHVDHVVRLA